MAFGLIVLASLAGTCSAQCKKFYSGALGCGRPSSLLELCCVLLDLCGLVLGGGEPCVRPVPQPLPALVIHPTTSADRLFPPSLALSYLPDTKPSFLPFPGLCPGSSDCMCTLNEGCSEPARNRSLFGGCSGQCRKVEHGRCPGSSDCLYDSGSCSGGGGGGCLQPSGSPCACAGKPADGNYFLTSFDGSTCSCGACHQYGDFFSADRQRFGCGASLNVCLGGTCVKLRVTDYGPSCFVENDAGGPVLDASPSVCKSLTGHDSCGWSDHFSVHVSYADEHDGRPYGPFNVTETEFLALVARGKEIEREKMAEEQ